MGLQGQWWGYRDSSEVRGTVVSYRNSSRVTWTVVGLQGQY